MEEGCEKQPVYNKPEEKVGIYCSEHKKEGMVDVKNKRCIESGCEKQPAYNKPEERVGIYCTEHKKEGMVNVVSKRCMEVGCEKQPAYNKPEERVGIYCSEHKKERMIDVVSKRCIEVGCDTRPTYNKEGEKKGIYCKEHSKVGMVDVINRRCIEVGCDTRPSYNKEGEKKGIYCKEHSKVGMVDVVSKRCKTPLCYTLVSKGYEYCLRCHIYMIPNSPRVRNYKTKERAVIDYVMSSFPSFTYATDKRIEGGCSMRRPDLMIDFGYQVIIVEVDENQHTDYDCSCENKRLMELSLDVGHRPIVFIRFNPDGYTSDGEEVKSCWTIDKKGACIVSKRRAKDWDSRLKTLHTTIAYWCHPQHRTDKTIEIIELFYDT